MHEAPRAVALGFLLSSLACTVTYSVAALPPTPAFALALAAARWERLESRMRRPIARPTVSGREASPAEHIWALEFAAGPARFALPPSSDGHVLLSMRSGPGVDPAPPLPRESCALVPRVTSGHLRPFSLCAVSWNVRSLLKTGARQILASFLAQQGCAVAFLQETRGQSEAFRAVGACPQSEGGAASYSVFAAGADTRAVGGVPGVGAYEEEGVHSSCVPSRCLGVPQGHRRHGNGWRPARLACIGVWSHRGARRFPCGRVLGGTQRSRRSDRFAGAHGHGLQRALRKRRGPATWRAGRLTGGVSVPAALPPPSCVRSLPWTCCCLPFWRGVPHRGPGYTWIGPGGRVQARNDWVCVGRGLNAFAFASSVELAPLC